MLVGRLQFRLSTPRASRLRNFAPAWATFPGQFFSFTANSFRSSCRSGYRGSCVTAYRRETVESCAKEASKVDGVIRSLVPLVGMAPEFFEEFSPDVLDLCRGDSIAARDSLSALVLVSGITFDTLLANFR